MAVNMNDVSHIRSDVRPSTTKSGISHHDERDWPMIVSSREQMECCVEPQHPEGACRHSQNDGANENVSPE